MASEQQKCLKTLGLTLAASEDEIKKAYKKLALQFHPDKNEDEDAKAQFQQISYAYKYLTDGPQSFNTYNESDQDDYMSQMFKEMFFSQFMFRGAGSHFYEPFGFYFDNEDDDDDDELFFSDSEHEDYFMYQRRQAFCSEHGPRKPSNSPGYVPQEPQISKKKMRKLEKKRRQRERQKEKKKTQRNEKSHTQQPNTEANIKVEPTVKEEVKPTVKEDIQRHQNEEIIRNREKKKQEEIERRQREEEARVIATDVLKKQLIKQEREIEKQKEKERKAAVEEKSNDMPDWCFEDVHMSKKARKNEKKRQTAINKQEVPDITTGSQQSQSDKVGDQTNPEEICNQTNSKTRNYLRKTDLNSNNSGTRLKDKQVFSKRDKRDDHKAPPPIPKHHHGGNTTMKFNNRFDILEDMGETNNDFESENASGISKSGRHCYTNQHSNNNSCHHDDVATKTGEKSYNGHTDNLKNRPYEQQSARSFAGQDNMKNKMGSYKGQMDNISNGSYKGQDCYNKDGSSEDQTGRKQNGSNKGQTGKNRNELYRDQTSDKQSGFYKDHSGNKPNGSYKGQTSNQPNGSYKGQTSNKPNGSYKGQTGGNKPNGSYKGQIGKCSNQSKGQSNQKHRVFYNSKLNENRKDLDSIDSDGADDTSSGTNTRSNSRSNRNEGLHSSSTFRNNSLPNNHSQRVYEKHQQSNGNVQRSNGNFQSHVPFDGGNKHSLHSSEEPVHYQQYYNQGCPPSHAYNYQPYQSVPSQYSNPNQGHAQNSYTPLGSYQQHNQYYGQYPDMDSSQRFGNQQTYSGTQYTCGAGNQSNIQGTRNKPKSAYSRSEHFRQNHGLKKDSKLYHDIGNNVTDSHSSLDSIGDINIDTSRRSSMDSVSSGGFSRRGTKKSFHSIETRGKPLQDYGHGEGDSLTTDQLGNQNNLFFNDHVKNYYK